MMPGMLDLIRVDRARFVDLITAPGKRKPLPKPRWLLTPGFTNRGVA
jgi:hypothetical protein